MAPSTRPPRAVTWPAPRNSATPAPGRRSRFWARSRTGFFTGKTTLDCLRRERAGALPAGFTRAFVTLEWLDDRPKKKAILEDIVRRYPAFPPAWKELAPLVEDPDARWRAITKGLEGSPDGETRGVLLINKAVILLWRGQRPEAVRILGELALDPGSTLAAETLAKATLAQVTRNWPRDRAGPGVSVRGGPAPGRAAQPGRSPGGTGPTRPAAPGTRRR
jgi:hypothetical protein